MGLEAPRSLGVLNGSTVNCVSIREFNLDFDLYGSARIVQLDGVSVIIPRNPSMQLVNRAIQINPELCSARKTLSVCRRYADFQHVVSHRHRKVKVVGGV